MALVVGVAHGEDGKQIVRVKLNASKRLTQSFVLRNVGRYPKSFYVPRHKTISYKRQPARRRRPNDLRTKNYRRLTEKIPANGV